jgi:hypothetical protein
MADPFLDTSIRSVTSDVSPVKRKLLSGALICVCIFIATTLGLSVAYGLRGSSHVGFLILAAVLFGFLVSTCTMLYYFWTCELDDKTKVIAVIQAVLVVGLCVGFFLIIYIKKQDDECWAKPACIGNPYSCLMTQPNGDFRCGNMTLYQSHHASNVCFDTIDLLSPDA